MAKGVTALDTNALEQLLVDGNFDAAKKMLDGYLNSDLSREIKGAAYVAFVMTYVSVMNRVYEKYNQALDETIANLNFADQKEKEVGEKIQLAKVKSDIKKMAK